MNRNQPIEQDKEKMQEATPGPNEEQPMAEQAMDPQTEQEINAYINGLSRMLHGKETQSSVMEMLKSGSPEQTIPKTALTVNSQMEAGATDAGKAPSLDVLLNAGIFLVNDLIEMGNAAGVFEVTTEDQVAPILQGTLQTYIEDGLAKGTIDPVELQQKVEPLMDDEHRALGNKAAQMTGIPQEADQSTAMQAYGAQQKRAGALKGGA